MNKKSSKKVLIVQIGRIGDMILTSPLFHLLRKKYPEWNISVLASSINYPVIKYSKDIDDIYIFKKNIFRLIFLIFKLRFNKIDIWIDGKNEYSRTSALILKYASPRNSYGYNKNKKIFDYDLGKYKQQNHYVDLNLSFLNIFEDCNYSIEEKRPVIDLPDTHSTVFDEIPNNKYFIFLNISAGQISRLWDKEKWINLMNSINTYKNSYFILHYMQRDKETMDFIRMNYQENNFYFFDEKIINFYQYIYLIKKSNLVISPDTAAIHIASAFNIPVIGLYPDVKWNYERFAPLSDVNYVIFSKNGENIKDIEPDEVFEKFKQLKDK